MVFPKNIWSLTVSSAKEGVEVLIPRKWGCGAFRNPSDVMAKAFMTQLKNYNFGIVEFGLATTNDVHNDEFVRHLGIAPYAISQ